MVRLAPHLACCSLAPHVFLDFKTDRFFTLTADLEAVFLRWSENPADHDAQTALEAAGLLVQAQQPSLDRIARHNPTFVPPSESLVEQANAHVPRARLLPIARTFARVSLNLAIGRLDRLLTQLASHRNAVLKDDPKPATLAFIAARQLIPFRPVCLRDSLVLASHLGHAGAGCQLIIGVKHHPFAAHSWVQHEAMVLNDSLDNVRGFRALIVV